MDQAQRGPDIRSELGEYREVVLFGDRIAYRQLGERGPVVVLLHGLGGDGRSWDRALAHLVDCAVDGGMTIVVPDLLGHGRSAKPRTDYSPGVHANVVRDLLDELGFQQATFIGHSLGGGIALQFAYQYPSRCEALVLVASGGLGGDVSGLLRAASAPGAGIILRALANRSVLPHIVRAVGGVLNRQLPILKDVEDADHVWHSMRESDTRAAFLATLRAVVDGGGQRVSALRRLTESAIPTLFIWGDRDQVIPIRHGEEAQSRVPGSELVIFPGAGHSPHRHDSARFAKVVQAFVHEVKRRRHQRVQNVGAPDEIVHERGTRSCELVDVR
ncbi:pimeloyl-ACP methyl ester carboxylesterase [Jatrophihabitans sp. GAS493]|uniref:alpha/beta fold hydrolase n=1 Tax=Jatrophihabitans sp. GAS493 TaxID=1907575 RepID=UPI000BB76871|nr:alpha/beta fold hydrolase [Jatrophihabitans sp. GAS493]SOD74995.1 pimeloyl-ACP methyl ester carboxylesterase [Jatrophihabitans sp. GAS493]